MSRAPAPPSPRERDLAQQLRDEIRSSGQSQHAVSKLTGVNAGQLSRFLAGDDIKLSTAARLAGPLGIRLVVAGRETKRRPGRPPKPRPDPHGWSQMSTDGEG